MCGVDARVDFATAVSLAFALAIAVTSVGVRADDGATQAGPAQAAQSDDTQAAAADDAQGTDPVDADAEPDGEATRGREPYDPAPEEPHGRVVAIARLAAIVEMERPVQVGEHLAIRVRVEDTCPYRVSVREDDCRVVARVVQVTGLRVRVALGLNEIVEVGNVAYRVIERRTGSRIAPPRRGGYVELGVSATLGGTVSTPGIFGFGAGFVGYRGVRPVFMRLEISPTGGIASGGTSDYIVGAVFFAGLDSRLFELGMGIGVARAYTWRSNVPLVAAAAATPVVMRFGALDGIHVGLRIDFFARNERMETGGGFLTLQVPTRVGAWIVGQVGGSLSGSYGVTVGYRRLLIGDNGPGSIYLLFGGGVEGVLSETTFSRDFFRPSQIGVAGTAGIEARVGGRRVPKRR